jgi:hypothetical protein
VGGCDFRLEVVLDRAVVGRKLRFDRGHGFAYCAATPSVLFFRYAHVRDSGTACASTPFVASWDQTCHIFSAPDYVQNRTWSDALEVLDQGACAAAEGFGRVDAFRAEVVELFVVRVEDDFLFIGVLEGLGALDVGVVCDGAGGGG